MSIRYTIHKGYKKLYLCAVSPMGLTTNVVLLLQPAVLQDLSSNSFVNYRQQIKYHLSLVMRHGDSASQRAMLNAKNQCDREFYRRKNSTQ